VSEGKPIELLRALDGFQPADELERDALQLARAGLAYLARNAPIGERLKCHQGLGVREADQIRDAAQALEDDGRTPDKRRQCELVRIVEYTMFEAIPGRDPWERKTEERLAELEKRYPTVPDRDPSRIVDYGMSADDPSVEVEITAEDLLHWWPENLRRELVQHDSRFEKLTVEDLRAILGRYQGRKNVSPIGIAAHLALSAGVEKKGEKEAWPVAEKRVADIFKKALKRKKARGPK
jgi:hypothetical protein